MKWKKLIGLYNHSERASVGEFELSIDWDNDACWTYTIEYHVHTVREFGDYTRSFGSKEKAKEAAEKWLLGQLKKMARSMGLDVSSRTMYRGKR